MNRISLVIWTLLAFGLAGCGDSTSKRFRFSGAVTLDGNPIPHGEVIITPDAAKKNFGPQGIAPIQAGRFDTANGTGMGIGGGPVIVRVNGMTGPGGKTLCEYEFTLDLPQTESTKDIDVPKKEAHNANKAGNKNVPEI